MNGKPVVVTTEHRGVFFGYVETEPTKLPAEIELTKARMCVFWDVTTKGVLGLAANGPSEHCKITHAIPKMTAYKITSVLDCSPEAAEKWEKGVWNK